MIARQRKLPISMGLHCEASSFVITECNGYAVEWLENWPSKLPGNFTCLVGDPRSGKSHMARIWANRHDAEFISARRTPQLEQLIYKWVNEISENPSIRKYFVIDDADEINNDVLLFCIYNTIIGVGAYMLLTARKAPTRWRVSLGDARSRLSTINVVSIRRPTEEAFARIVDTMLRQRGILIPESALLGIINQTERSYESAINIVEAIDNIRDYSRSKISRIVRQILNNP